MKPLLGTAFRKPLVDDPLLVRQKVTLREDHLQARPLLGNRQVNQLDGSVL